MDNTQFQQLLAALQQGLQPLQPPPQAPSHALLAKLQKIKDANLKLAKSIKDKKSSKGKKDDKGRSGKSGGFKKGKQAINKYAWKREPPKEGQPKTKEIKGRTYHWCKEHMAGMGHSFAGEMRSQAGMQKTRT
jgi:hypothetical protein